MSIYFRARDDAGNYGGRDGSVELAILQGYDTAPGPSSGQFDPSPGDTLVQSRQRPLHLDGTL